MRPSNSAGGLQMLSVVIPAKDEEAALPSTVREIHQALAADAVPHEIIVVDDGSHDQTWAVVQQLKDDIPVVVPLKNPGPSGFGRAVIHGLDTMSGDAVVIMMADASDEPADAVRYWRALNAGYDCVFGSRFIDGGTVVGYPPLKRFINRMANTLIKLLFRIPFNDTTNAFKAYRRATIAGCRPLLAPHFNLTVELPLKAVVRGFSWTVIPISWKNRRQGVAKLKIKEMGSRYFFICAYVWLEKYFSRGDYRAR